MLCVFPNPSMYYTFCVVQASTTKGEEEERFAIPFCFVIWMVTKNYPTQKTNKRSSVPSTEMLHELEDCRGM